METNILVFIGGPLLFIFFLGIRIVRPTHRGLIERLGKYPAGSELVNIIGEMAGVIPIHLRKGGKTGNIKIFFFQNRYNPMLLFKT